MSRILTYGYYGAILAGVVSAQAALPLVDSSSLRALITEQGLMAKAQLLEDFAYATPEGNRVVGSPGLDASLQYIMDALNALDYYDVTTQNFSIPTGSSTLSIDGTAFDSSAFTFSPAANIVAPLVAVSNLGCNASDYPADLSGKIALIPRGTCAFVLKGALAGGAGAAGVLMYNNVEGVLEAGLSASPSPEGPFVPTAGISQADGLALAASIGNGTAVTATLTIVSTEIPTYNIIAQTRTGDTTNVLQLGAHTDSVKEGPGLNDDGSGTIGLLEVAQALANFSVTNAVRFSWWSAEETGIVGADTYVDSLDQAALDAIRLYLNFDMIGSPNYLIGIYDATNMSSYMNISIPAGSLEAETLWKEYFVGEAGLNWQYFNLRDASDHAPFARAGVPFGGLFTGGSEIMSEEQALLFNGTAGISSDINNHKAGDNFTNISPEAMLLTTKAIAHAVGTYAVDFSSLPAQTVTRRAENRPRSAELRR